MKCTISLLALLLLLSFFSGYAIAQPDISEANVRVLRYQKLTALLHSQYLNRIEAVKAHLKSRIPHYRYDSFYGASSADTLWAKTITQDLLEMAEIHAENQSEKSSSVQPEPVVFKLIAGKIIFQHEARLGRYKADPVQQSVIRVTPTANGPRVAASTVLTEEGMALQEKVGCMGCHRS